MFSSYESYPCLKMFPESLWLILAKPFAKTEIEPEDQCIARLGAMKQTLHIEKVIEELELDEPRETKSTENKALILLQSREIGDTGDDNDLNSDSKKLCRLQIHNSRLISELADATLSAEILLQDYENEKRARKILEDKCDQLEKKLANAAKILESMSRKSEYMREEFENEMDSIRIAMHMQQGALQMKQEDTKLILERKYEELDDLRCQLEAFVRKNCGNYATEAVHEAEVLLEKVHTAKVIYEGDLIPTAP